MKSLKIFFTVVLAISTLFLTSCSDDDTEDETPAPAQLGTMKVEFEHVWGPDEAPFHLNENYTHSITNEELSFTTMRYYVSNIKLMKNDGTEFSAPNAYFIIDASDNGMHEVEIENVPAGDYESISFLVGVDSLRNVSGAQEGALSASEGMFWSWNSGYIFVKAEGISAAAENNAFAYHIGGFAGENKAQREHYMDFDGALLEVTPNATPTVHLIVNPASFWNGMMSLGTLSNMTMPGPMASMLANHFATGFRFDHIHN